MQHFSSVMSYSDNEESNFGVNINIVDINIRLQLQIINEIRSDFASFSLKI